jgi:serine protease Do
MLKRRPTAGTVGIAALLLACAQSLPAAAANLPDFISLVKQAEPAVVNIRADGEGTTSPELANPHGNPHGLPDLPEDSPLNEFFKRFFQQRPDLMPQQEEPTHSLGSGFIISPDGYVLTAAHVVKDADAVTVRLAEREERPAKVVGLDETSDVALLKIDGQGLPTLQIGDSDKLQVGEWVLAIGSPFGLEHTATQGIVSALGRALPSDTYVPFIQTDVAVNPGNSGGPLFNNEGQVVGINSQIFSKTGGYMGLSFAIPINVAMNVAEQLKTKGHVERGWLGVLIQGVNQDLADSFGLDRPRGALVAQVMPDSPALKAGLRTGDIITGFDGKSVEESAKLPPLVGNTPVGKSVPITVLRGGKTLELQVTIQQLVPEAQAKAGTKGSTRQLNMAVVDLSAEQRGQLGLDDRGVLVKEVAPGPAASAGVRADDVILMLNHVDVKSASQFSQLVKKLPPGKPVPLLVQRGDGRMFLALTLPDRK